VPRFFSKPEVCGAFHSLGMTLDSLSFLFHYHFIEWPTTPKLLQVVRYINKTVICSHK